MNNDFMTMKKQLHIFFVSLMFYSRIPSPIKVTFSPEYLNKATRYFPLVGWIIGLISWVVFWLGQLVFPIEIAVIASCVAGIFATGAFHEDGFADMVDGFGGGWTSTQILDIMKDSRVGNYGALSLILLMLIKIYALIHVMALAKAYGTIALMLVFVTYHALARWAAVQLIVFSTYARENDKSKAKDIGHFDSFVDAVGAYFFGLLPLAALCYFHWYHVLVLFPIVLIVVYFMRYFEKWIGGYTGDCLGAVEQITECAVLLEFLLIWKFT